MRHARLKRGKHSCRFDILCSWTRGNSSTTSRVSDWSVLRIANRTPTTPDSRRTIDWPTPGCLHRKYMRSCRRPLPRVATSSCRTAKLSATWWWWTRQARARIVLCFWRERWQSPAVGCSLVFDVLWKRNLRAYCITINLFGKFPWNSNQGQESLKHISLAAM